MFQSISLGNFKAFGSTQRIPIRPLTLIFGPNSAGKSSFIHGLLFAHEAHTSNAPNNFDVKRPRLGGDSVDLGGFRQFVHKRNVNHRMEWGAEFNTCQLLGRLAELLAPVKTVAVLLSIGLSQIEVFKKELRFNPKTGKEELTDLPTGTMKVAEAPRVEGFQIVTDGRVLLRASPRRRGDTWQMALDELDGDNPVIRTVVRAIVESTTTTEALREEDFETVQQTINDLVPKIVLERGRLIPRGIEKSLQDVPASQQATLFPISRGNRQTDLRQAIEFFLPRTLDELLRGLESIVGSNLDHLKYLGPLRSYPSRHLAFAEDHSTNWYAGGGYAWDLVRTNSELRKQVNEWLGASWMKTRYELRVRDLYSADDLEDPFLQCLTEIEERLIEEFETESEEGVHHGVLPEDYYPSFTDNRQVHPTPRSVQVLPEDYYPSIEDPDGAFDSFRELLPSSGAIPIKDLVLVDVAKKTIVSHRDVGIGVSQVLPVLVSAFAADNECVAIEQPEIHLHPALQAELGDVFINAALGGKQNTFLLETHSEHLILRIMRRIRETTTGKLPEGCQPIRPEDVTVIYVEPDTDGSLAREMPLNELGVLVKAWPGGFFEEGLKEVF